MKKRILIIGMIFAALFAVSCEEDDVCVGEGTPYLTVVFKNIIGDVNFTDTIIIQKLLADGQTLDTTFVTQRIFTDSIKLALGGLDESTSFYEIRRRTTGIPDILTVNYSPKTSFVSKACGFRLTYDNLSYESTENTIRNIVPSESNVLENESATNLYIYYIN